MRYNRLLTKGEFLKILLILLIVLCVHVDLCSADLEEQPSTPVPYDSVVKPLILGDVEEVMAPCYDDYVFKGGCFVLNKTSVRCAMTAEKLLAMEQCQPLLLMSGSTKALKEFDVLFKKTLDLHNLQSGAKIKSKDLILTPEMIRHLPDSMEAKADMLLYTAFSMSAIADILDVDSKRYFLGLLGEHLLNTSKRLMQLDLQSMQSSLASSYERVFENQPALGVDQTLMKFLKEYAPVMFEYLDKATQKEPLECFGYAETSAAKLYKEGWNVFFKAQYRSMANTESDETDLENPAVLLASYPQDLVDQAKRNLRKNFVMPFNIHKSTDDAGQYIRQFIKPLVVTCRLFKGMHQFQEANRRVATKERGVEFQWFRLLNEVYEDSPRAVRAVAGGDLKFSSSYAQALENIITAECEAPMILKQHKGEIGVCSRESLHDYLWETVPQFAYIFEHIHQMALEGADAIEHPSGLPMRHSLNFSMLPSPENALAYLVRNATLIVRLTQLSIASDRFTPLLKEVLEDDVLSGQNWKASGKDSVKSKLQYSVGLCNNRLEDLNQASSWQCSSLTWKVCKKHMMKVSQRYESLWSAMKRDEKFNWDACTEELYALKVLWFLGNGIRLRSLSRLLNDVVVDTKFALLHHDQEKLSDILKNCGAYHLDCFEVPQSWNLLSVDALSSFAYQFAQNSKRIVYLSEGINLIQNIKWSNQNVADQILNLMISELGLLLSVPEDIQEYRLSLPRHMHALSVIVRAWQYKYTLSVYTEDCTYPFKEDLIHQPKILQEHFPKVLAWHKKIFKAYVQQLQAGFGAKVDSLSENADLPTEAASLSRCESLATTPKRQSSDRLFERVERALKLLGEGANAEGMNLTPAYVLHSEIMKSWWSEESNRFEYTESDLQRLVAIISQHPECVKGSLRTLKNDEKALQVIGKASAHFERSLAILFKETSITDLIETLQEGLHALPPYSYTRDLEVRPVRIWLPTLFSGARDAVRLMSF